MQIPGNRADGAQTRPAQSLARIISALGITADYRWAWDHYEEVVGTVARVTHAKRFLEIGGGRDPLFDAGELAAAGITLTVNDISASELARLPDSYHKAVFDVAGDISGRTDLHGQFDLIFSQMVFEHVSDGEKAWANVYDLLAPGGVALAFIPTLYALPFIANKLLPDAAARKIVQSLYRHRGEQTYPVFPARYSFAYASESKLKPMLAAIGYREMAALPFYGHEYYARFPLVRTIHRQFTALAKAKDWRVLASYAYIIVRK